MARKRTVTTTVDDADDPKNDDYSDFLEGLTGNTRIIKLFRIGGPGSRQKWLANYEDTSALTEEQILENFGPGRYLVRARTVNDKGWLPGRLFEIEGPPRPEVLQPQSMDNTGFMERLFAVMHESQQRTHELLVAMLGRPAAATTTDPTTVVTAMIAGMGSLKQLTAGPSDDLDKVAKIIEIADKLGGNSNQPKDVTAMIFDMAKDVVPALIASSRAIAPLLPPETPRAETPPAKVEPAKVETPAAPTPEVQLQMKVRDLWQKVNASAQRNDDPEELAATIGDLAELLDDEAAEVLLVSIDKSENFDAWKKVIAIAPPFEGWFSKFFEAVKTSMKEQPAEETKAATA